MQEKLLYIVPHLSSGGLPCYTLKKIKTLISDYDIYVVEYSCISLDYIVHRKQIIDILSPNHFFTLGENKKELLDIIKSIDPDIIHLEEIPEMFMDLEIAKQIYCRDRKYRIFETTHSSDFKTQNKIFLPDKFMFVCPFSKAQYANLGIQSEVVEFPIDLVAPNKEEARKKLNLDPTFKHVVVVGLFTPRKNQRYAFELARGFLDKKVLFHFVGNQAPNFEYYWKPLMEQKPSNCIIWGERNDVDVFLSAVDLSLFPSEGRTGDKELNPLVIKESLEKYVPVLMYNLDVYLGKYNNNSLVKFLTGKTKDDMETINDILNGPTNIPTTDNVFTEEIGPKDINTYYNEIEKKIYFKNLTILPYTFDYCVVKELASEVPIYFCKNLQISPEYLTWIVPIGGYDFDADEYCSGFLIEFYDNRLNLLFKKEIFIKEIKKKNIHKIKGLSLLDCLYINYREFFHVGAYEGFDFDNLDTVVDIGANVGLFADYITTKGAQKIYCVEPNTKAFESLCKLSNFNKNITPIKIAIDTQTGEKDIYCTEDNTTISRFEEYLENSPYSYQYKKENTQTITWKDFINQQNIKYVSLLKMDIEGHEYKIFEQIDENDLNKIERIILEFHRNNDKQLIDVVKKLQKNNFEIAFRKQSTQEPGNPFSYDGVLLARKKDRKNVKEAFVTFTTEQYLPLAEYLVKSVKEFSTRPVILFAVNCNIPFDYPNLVKMRIDVQSPNPVHIPIQETIIEGEKIIPPNDYQGCVDRNNILSFQTLNLKPLVMLGALEIGVEKGIFLDADGLAKENIDDLFYNFKDIEDYPLAGKNIHEHVILNGRGNIWDGDKPIEFPLMDKLNVTSRSCNYVTTNLILFTPKTKEFLNEWVSFIPDKDMLESPAHYLPFQDETLFNVLLWKKVAKKTLPILFYNLIDLNCCCNFYQETKTNVFMESRWQFIPETQEQVVYFHGCKSLSEVSKSLDYIKDLKGFKKDLIQFVTNRTGCFKKIGIVTLYDHNYTDLARYSIPNFKQYAQKHNYGFCFYDDYLDIAKPIQWQKLLAIKENLDKYDWLWWIDVDSLIMNFDIKLEDIIDHRYDIIFTKNKHSYISDGSAFYKNVDLVQKFLSDAYELQRPELKDINPYIFDHEQQAIRVLAKDPIYASRIKLIDEKVCNSYWITDEPTVLNSIPDWNASDNIYKEGDFVIQFCGRNIDERIRLMKGFSSKVCSLKYYA